MAYNTGGIQATIGADMSAYESAMSKVQSATEKAMSAAQKIVSNRGGQMAQEISNILNRMADKTQPLGKRIGQGLADGLKLAIGQVQRIASRIGEKLPQPIQRGLAKVSQAFTQFKDKASSSLSQLDSNLGAKLSGSLERLGIKFKQLGHGASAMSRSVASSMPQAFQGAITTIGNQVSKLSIRVGNSLKGMSRQFAVAGDSSSQSFIAGLRSMVSGASSTVNQIANRFNPLIQHVGNVANKLSTAMGSGFNKMAQKASSGLNRITSYFAKGTSGAKSFGTSVKSMFAAFSLANIAQRGMQMLTSSIGGAIDRFDTLKQFPKIMQSWGYSAGEAKKATDRLSEGIDGLPTTLDEITNATKSFVVSGLDLNKSADAAIAFNNAMLANGASAVEASNGMTQLTQMLAVGKPDMQAWNSLTIASGKALNDVAEEMLGAGSNSRDLYSALQSGQISMEEFVDKMIEMDQATGGFAEQALKGSEGIKTSMAIIRAAVTRGMADVITAFDEVLESRGLPNIAQSIANLKPIINDAFGFIIDKAGAVVDKFQQIGLKGTVALMALPSVVPVVISAVGTLGVALGGIGTSFISFGSKVSAVFSGMSSLMSTVAGAMTGLGSTLATAGSVGMSALGGMTQAMISLAGVALSALAPAVILGLIVGALGLINNAFGQEISNMLTTVTEKGPQVIEKFVAGITSRIPQLITSGTMLVMQLGQAIATNLPVIVQAGMDILGSIVRGVMQNMGSLMATGIQIITAIVTSIISALPQLILMGMQVILSFVQGLVQNIPLIVSSSQEILDQFKMGIETYLPQIIQTGIQILLQLVQGLVTAIPQLLPIGLEVITTIINAIVQNLPMIIQGAIQIIMSLATGILQNLPQIMSTGAQIILSLISGIAQALPQIIVMGLQLIIQLVISIVQNLPKIFQVGGQIIMALGQGILEAIGGFLAGVIESVGNVFSGLWNKLTGKSKETEAQVTNDFSSMANNAHTSATEMATNVGIQADQATNNLTEASSLAKLNGTMNYDELSANVLNSTSQLAKGVDVDAMSATSSLSAATSEANALGSQNYQTASSNIVASMREATSGVSSQTVEQASSVASNSQNAAQSAQGAYSGMSKNVVSEMNSQTQAVQNGMQKQRQAIQQGVKTQSQTVNQSLKKQTQIYKQSYNQIANTVRTGMQKITNNLRITMSQSVSTVRSGITRMVTAFRSGIGQARSAGVQTGAGFRYGLASQVGGIMAVAYSIANRVSATLRRALSIHSPSRVMEKLGSYTGEGFYIGMGDWLGQLGDLAKEYADTVIGQKYQTESVVATTGRIVDSGVISQIDDMQDRLDRSEIHESQFIVKNEIVGDRIYTVVEMEKARRQNKNQYFK